MHSVQQHYTYGEKSNLVIPAKAGIQIFDNYGIMDTGFSRPAGVTA